MIEMLDRGMQATMNGYVLVIDKTELACDWFRRHPHLTFWSSLVIAIAHFKVL